MKLHLMVKSSKDNLFAVKKRVPASLAWTILLGCSLLEILECGLCGVDLVGERLVCR